MNNESDYEQTLKTVAKYVGFGLLIISAFFSWDGFDQSVTGGNDAYTTILTNVIAIAMVVAISVVQFVLSTRYDKLNLTLKVIGFASYAYSIYTNYMGAVHILGMSTEIALAVAFALDVTPEPLISWAFGDSAKGDILGNLLKWGFQKGKPYEPSYQNKPNQFKPQQESTGKFRPNNPNTRPINPQLKDRLGNSPKFEQK